MHFDTKPSMCGLAMRKPESQVGALEELGLGWVWIPLDRQAEAPQDLRQCYAAHQPLCDGFAQLCAQGLHAALQHHFIHASQIGM